MKCFPSPRVCFVLCKTAGFCLLFAFWMKNGEPAGFFLLLFLVVMSLLRWRIPKLNFTVMFDFIVCAALPVSWQYTEYALILPLFEAMYFGLYWFAFSTVYLIFEFSLHLAVFFAIGALCGIFLGCWERERRQKLALRDTEAGRYYELESLQNDLTAALAQVEKMTLIAERARIAREIHDNAGHEIVAAYISLQTVREMIDSENTVALELYDAALERLNSGANKIREAVHNLSTTTFLGVESLRETCRSFPACQVDLSLYGDTSRIPMYVWSMLEACLNETLTNVARHSTAKRVSVDLDTTLHIVRLCVENDGVTDNTVTAGSGLRNLRHRAAAIGGSLSVETGEVFRVICVIPIQENFK